MTLYELTGQILELQELMEDDVYEPELINDTMESVMYDFQNKADDYVKLIKNIEAQIFALDEEAKRLKARQDKMKNKVKMLKDKLVTAMVATGTRKLQGTVGTLSLRRSTKIPSELTWENVPQEYVKTEVKKSIDKVSLTSAIKEGKVEGIELEETNSLLIK